tara:strand:+ start:614 stop:2287 length:1674 start_codon:yes stop_codon:yes gene_type:complete
MDNNFDTNINNYSYHELLEIIGLHINSNKETIKNKLNQIIEKLKTRDDNNFLDFFIRVKKRLLSDNQHEYEDEDNEDEDNEDNEDNDDEDNEDNEDNEDEEGYNDNKQPNNIDQVDFWLQNQFLPPTNKSKLERLTERNKAVDFLKSPNNPVMHRKHLGVTNNIPLQVGQDSLNPNLRQIENRMIMIDSKDRTNISYDEDPNSISSPTNFTCNLSINLQNVISMRVTSICIPSTFTVIDKFIGNNFFTIEKDEIEPTNIVIPDGNYKLNDLRVQLNNAVNNIPVSGISLEICNNKIKIINTVSRNRIIFFDPNRSLNLTDISNGIRNIPNYTTSLGYYLGFRRPDPESNSIWDLSGDLRHCAQTVPNIVGSRYFNLCVDDFQNNQSSSSFVNIIRTNDKLSLPSYISGITRRESRNERLERRRSSTIDCTGGRDDGRKLIQSGRTQSNNTNKLTQRQLFSANQILDFRIKPNTRQEALNNQHVLATINIPPNVLHNENITSITFDNIAKDSGHVRKYFGPVDIQRLKISLYDNYGFLVNLNNHDWNFTLQVEQLYQY